MAYCPKCRAAMAQTATVCPKCGYDFPATEVAPHKGSGLKTVLGLLLAVLVCVLLYLAYQFRNGVAGLFK